MRDSVVLGPDNRGYRFKIKTLKLVVQAINGGEMLIRLSVFCTLLFCSSVMATQVVYTATPKDNSFKFVFSEGDGIYTPEGDDTSVRCRFNKHLEGLDNKAEPYFAIIFKCPKEMTMSVKIFKKDNRSFFIATSPYVEGTASTEVFIKEDHY